MGANPGEQDAQHRPVATFERGDSDYNTIALEGIDIVIPLEEDLDCDPLQDDEIRLQNLDGTFEKILKASGPDATPEHGSEVIHYNFRKVPAGFYRISVRVGEAWVDVSTDLMVTPRGAFFRGAKLKQEPPPVSYQARKEEVEITDSDDDTWIPELPEFMDLNESFRDI